MDCGVRGWGFRVFSVGGEGLIILLIALNNRILARAHLGPLAL